MCGAMWMIMDFEWDTKKETLYPLLKKRGKNYNFLFLLNHNPYSNVSPMPL